MKMGGPDRQDVVGGLLLIAVGLFAAIYAMSSYRLGTVARMGPGMAPVILGVLLVGLGLLLLVHALLRRTTAPVAIEWRPLLAISAGMGLFGLLVDRVGMIPCVILLVVVTSLADNRIGLSRVLLLAGVMCVLAVGIFTIGLGMPIRMIRWPA